MMLVKFINGICILDLKHKRLYKIIEFKNEVNTITSWVFNLSDEKVIPIWYLETHPTNRITQVKIGSNMMDALR